MTRTTTQTRTTTYTTTDIANVVRRMTADLVMIAQCTGAITEVRAREYAHDIEALAQGGYLAAVDVTLLTCGEYGTEVSATTYTVNTASGELSSSRPGGLMWPRVNQPYLRIILTHTAAYDAEATAKLKPKLKRPWTGTTADTSHSNLARGAGRDYASNGYGLRRKDFNK